MTYADFLLNYEVTGERTISDTNAHTIDLLIGLNGSEVNGWRFWPAIARSWLYREPTADGWEEEKEFSGSRTHTNRYSN